MFIIGQNLKHVYMTYFFLEILIFWLTLGIYCLQFQKQSSKEAVVQRCYLQKVFFKISQNSQENTCARVSFSIKSQNFALQLY